MPRCSGKAVIHSQKGPSVDPDRPTSEMLKFWSSLELSKRKALLSVDRKSIFTRIRQQFCSRCYGLFVLRYEEMKGTAALDCPACQEFYAGLVVSDSGEIGVEDAVLADEPFGLFAEGKLRERERQLQFMTGDICGSGFQKRPGINMCALHSSPVPVEALLEYFRELPQEHRSALLTLREEDFAAELDAHLKYQLRICRDCRSNVTRAYRDIKTPTKGSGEEAPCLELCPDFTLKVAERLVTVDGEGIAEFFNRAEDVEGCKAFDQEDDYYDDPDQVRHAETPELAREALVDCAVLIYKSQIEVAFREQTAGHNALLLFVGLALNLMEEQLENAFKELGAKEAEAELLDLVAKEKQREASKGKKKAKKGRAAEKEDTSHQGQVGRQAPPPPPTQPRQCQQCTALQSCRCGKGSPPRRRPVTPPPRTRPSGSSPTGTPRSHRGEHPRVLEVSGEWEVQQGKRRSTPQGAKKGGVLGGSSSGSTSPERSRRASLEGGCARNPFARATSGAHGPPDPPRKRPTAIPIPMPGYTASGAVQPPPPPPPPREPRTSARIPAEPSLRKAWQVRATPQIAIPLPAATCKPEPQQWDPWSGRSPALEGQLEKLMVGGVGVGAGPKAVGGPVGPRTHRAIPPHVEGAGSGGMHDAFSLFQHFSPVSPAAGPLLTRSTTEPGTSSGYQLFGANPASYPLAPLAPVISL